MWKTATRPAISAPERRLGGKLLILLLALTLVACRSIPYEEVEIDLEPGDQAAASTARTSEGGQLKVAVVPMVSPENTHRQYAQLIRRIGQIVGTGAILRQRRTYREVNDLLGAGQLDIAFLCTGGYLHLRESAPDIEILGVPVVKGKTTYHSLLIVNAESDVESFETLKGSRLAFTCPLSISGYMYTQHRVKELGHDPAKFFSSVMFLYNHDRSIRAVARGLSDAAAVSSLVFEQLLSQGTDEAKAVRIIERSPPFGNPPVVVSPRLSAKERARLTEIFLHLHEDPEAAALLRVIGVERYVRPADGLYRSAAAMLPTGK